MAYGFEVKVPEQGGKKVKKAWFSSCALVMTLIAVACVQRVSMDTNVPRMTKEELRSIMDRPDTAVYRYGFYERLCSERQPGRMVRGQISH